MTLTYFSMFFSFDLPANYHKCLISLFQMPCFSVELKKKRKKDFYTILMDQVHVRMFSQIVRQNHKKTFHLGLPHVQKMSSLNKKIE